MKRPYKTLRYMGLLALFLGLFWGDTFSQTDSRKLLIFSARRASLKPFSFAGHGFVSWATQPTAHSGLAAKTSLGLFPKDGQALPGLVVSGLPAEVVSGFKANSRRVPTFQAIFEFELKLWEAALDTAKNWNGRRYFLLTRNCVSFMDGVAEAAGMNTPSMYFLWIFPRHPVRWLKLLAKRNTEKQVEINTPVRYEFGEIEPETYSIDKEE
jgi:hypothetical protein